MTDYRIDLKSRIARAYLTDARDFLFRFDFLLEEYSKTKRMKCFVDLLMGFECALKAHIFLSQKEDDPKSLYRKVKNAGHNIRKLSSMASFNQDRSNYTKVAVELGKYSVYLRYALDGYESFFPSGLSLDKAELAFTETLSNNKWLVEKRNLLEELIVPVNTALTGWVNVNIAEILDSDDDMREFALDVGIARHKNFLANPTYRPQ